MEGLAIGTVALVEPVADIACGRDEAVFLMSSKTFRRVVALAQCASMYSETSERESEPNNGVR